MLYGSIRELSDKFPENRIWSELSRCLKDTYTSSLLNALRQESAIKRLLKHYEEYGINCIPLKGWVIRESYPDPHIRTMADFDVLIRGYDYKKLLDIMKQIGFVPLDKNEAPWKHDNFYSESLHVETHKCLSKKNMEMNEWEYNIWNNARKTDGYEHIYEMSDIDFVIYFFLHMYQHFQNGHLALRSLIDIKMIDSKYDLNQDIVNSILKKLNIYDFVRNVQMLSEFLFHEKELTPNEEILFDYAFCTNFSNSMEQYKIARAVKSSLSSYAQGRCLFLFVGRLLAIQSHGCRISIFKEVSVSSPRLLDKKSVFLSRKRQIKKCKST